MSEKLEFVISAEDRYSGAFKKLKNALPSLKTVILSTSAAFAGAGTAILALTKQTADYEDKIAKLSSRLGISTEALSTYQYVAERSGVTVETLNLGFQRMTRRISEAAQGAGEASAAIEEIGLNAKQLNQLSPDKQFEAIAQAMDGVGNQADKVRLAMRFFDSEGVALIQTLKDGKAGLDEMKESAKRLGLVVSADAAKNAEKFKDSLTDLQGSLNGIKYSIAQDLIPKITEWTNKLSGWITENKPKILKFISDFREDLLNLRDWFIRLSEKAELIKGALGAIITITLIAQWKSFAGTIESTAHALDILHSSIIVDKLLELKTLATTPVGAFLTTAPTLIGRISESLMVASVAVGTFYTAWQFGTWLKDLDVAGKTVQAWTELVYAHFEKLFVDIYNKSATIIADFIADWLYGFNEILKGASKLPSWLGGDVAANLSTDIEAKIKTLRDGVKGLETDAEAAKAKFDSLFAILNNSNGKPKKPNKPDNSGPGDSQGDNAQTTDEEPKGLQPYTDANIEKTLANIERIKEMYAEYTESERERLSDWYEEESSLLQEQRDNKEITEQQHLETLAQLREIYFKRLHDAALNAQKDQKKVDTATEKQQTEHWTILQNLASQFGEKGNAIAQKVGAVRAFISTLVGEAKALELPFPENLFAAAKVLAVGLGVVSQIKGVAHGGMDFVPQEGTFLLNRGERVLSPRQNEDLTGFLNNTGGQSASIQIGEYHNHIMEDVTNPSVLMSMSPDDWRDVTIEKIIPAMQEAAALGFKV